MIGLTASYFIAFVEHIKVKPYLFKLFELKSFYIFQAWTNCLEKFGILTRGEFPFHTLRNDYFFLVCSQSNRFFFFFEFGSIIKKSSKEGYLK